jgi:hypothetical protein
MAGETSGTAASVPFSIPAGMFLVPFTTAFGAAENETNDVKNVGYLPKGITVYGVHYRATDMDTNVSPALVHKITVGSTDIVTGLTGGQTGAGLTAPCIPLTLTADTLVTITSTTAAATGAAGTVYTAFICQR